VVTTPRDLAPLLDYLSGIGYGEIYLPSGAAGANPAEGGAAAPARTGAAGAAAGASSRASAASPGLRAPAAPADADRVAATPRAAAPTRPAGESPTRPAADAPGLTADSALFGPAPTGCEQFQTLDALGEFVRGCTRCRLAEGRNRVVFGSGSPFAELMLVGEGPGAEEDRQGLPFVGPAGELLTKILAAIGLERDAVYITNVVKCRPPGNRDPLPDEAGACRGYLERQIDLVRPRVIVALGRVAAQTLLASELPLGRLRGRWHTVRGVPTRATYHPAALLRNASWKRPTWEDMQLVRDRLRAG
jgi:uracil-DNA glycosylase